MNTQKVIIEPKTAALKILAIEAAKLGVSRKRLMELIINGEAKRLADENH